MYFEAIGTALESEISMAWGDQDERQVRDFLARLRDTLDSRRPWARAPYTRLATAEWTKYRSATPLGRMSLDTVDAGGRISRAFEDVEGGRVVVLRLRTGQVVLLTGPARIGEREIVLRAHTEDVEGTLDDFCRLTGFASAEIERL